MAEEKYEFLIFKMDYKLINNKENHNYLAMIINESDKYGFIIFI